MIRFIEIGNQIVYGGSITHFAWWDTVTDSFMTFNGEQAFETWEDFEASLKHDEYAYDLNQFKYLFTRRLFDDLEGGGE